SGTRTHGKALDSEHSRSVVNLPVTACERDQVDGRVKPGHDDRELRHRGLFTTGPTSARVAAATRAKRQKAIPPAFRQDIVPPDLPPFAGSGPGHGRHDHRGG